MKSNLYILSILVVLIFSFSSCERKSGRKNSHNQSQNTRIEQSRRSTFDSKSKTIIKMTKRSGVYFIPCKINGSEMEFIFDTGASDITISLTEALFLYKQGTLTDDDFIGTQQYQIANGEVEEGTVVKLKTVEIGNRNLYNVQASIVHNLQAPLLLGQSALNKFGKISIDYGKNEITFE
jgi:aspartyl protease family protein